MLETKSVQLRMTLAFAGVILGFVGAVVYVPLALWPVAQRAESIQTRRAEAVLTLGELRSAAVELRSAAVHAYELPGDAPVVRAEQERAVAAARQRIRSAEAEYLRIPRPSEIDRVWRQLADVELPALEAAAASPHPGSDPTALRRVLAAGVAVDQSLQELTKLNAAGAQREAEQIHARIRRLAIGYAVLAVLGSAGALLLLTQILALFRSYASAADRRVSELEAFAGQVSHDLRSPLQSIQLAVNSIERKAQDVSLQRTAARASASVRRLDGMIRDLLQFARSGAAGAAGARADVRAVLDALREELGPTALRAGVALTIEGEPGLHARAAPVALEAILANLVENAVKYRRPDAHGRVDVSATSEGARVVLTVKDDGVGIAPELLPHIFDPFVRGAKRPDSYGLGLATVKRLVESNHGTIAVASELGRGSTFSVTFQRAEPSTSFEACAASSDAPASSRAPGAESAPVSRAPSVGRSRRD